MKKAFRLILILICLLSFLPFSYAQDIKNLKYMTEEYPPYNFKKDGKLQGFYVDILLLMLKELDPSKSRKDINLYPWARGYFYLQTENNTVLFATKRTKRRENLFKWVGPVFKSHIILLGPKYKKIKIKKFKKLQEYAIGTVRNDVGEQLLIAKGYPKGLLKPVSKPYMNAKKLDYGRIDLWAYGKIQANWVLKENGINPNKYESVYELASGEGGYYAFNPHIPDSIIKKFQDTLDKLKKEGKAQEIINSYLRLDKVNSKKEPVK